MAKRGRKNKYYSHVEPRLEEIKQWCRDGLIEEEMCKKLGISVWAINEYKKQFPELTKSLRENKEIADGKVEDSLYQRAIGFDYDETETIKDAAGKILKTRIVTKKVLPDVTAIIVWLKNRLPGKWRDKQAVDLAAQIIYHIEEIKKPKPEEAQ
jgi:hypothetical protein